MTTSTTRPVYLTTEQLDAMPVGTVVHRPRVAISFNRTADGWRPCSPTSGRALPNSPGYPSWQVAADGVTL